MQKLIGIVFFMSCLLFTENSNSNNYQEKIVLQSKITCRNINHLLSTVRISSHFTRGRFDGLTLSNIKQDSIFNIIGLKTDDIIVDLNSKPHRSISFGILKIHLCK